MNLSPNVEDELFCDGISEEIINALAKTPDLYVTSRTSSFHFKNQEHSITEIADKLSVCYIVEGSVRRSGEDIRITVQLINAQDDYHYWSQNYDRKFENIFQIQDEIAQDVRETFRELTGHFNIEDSMETVRHGASIEAYECVLRARRIATDLSAENVSIGLDLIERAIELEPGNPTYHATKATFIIALGVMGAMPLEKSALLAEVSCNVALEIDPNDPAANALRGYMIFAQTGNVKQFYHFVNKALELHPKLTFALYFKSIISSAIGKYEESMAALDVASEVNPMSQLPIYFRCINLMRLRKFDEALEEAERFLLQHPDHLNIYSVKGLIYLRTGKSKLALAHFCKMPTTGGKIPYYGGMAMASALMGNISLAEDYLAKADYFDHNLHLSYKENPKVLVNFLLGRFEEGFEELKKDVANHAWYLRFYKTNPFFDPILSDPRSKMLESLLAEVDYDSVETTEKYAKSGLDEKEVTALSKKLEELMITQKPYLDPELSLKKLAGLMGVSTNNLSQVINSEKSKNFFDYINSFRIKELMNKLNSDENRQFTILSLAMDSGFNSKSAFNASFKKLTGLTPSEYLKSIDVMDLDR